MSTEIKTYDLVIIGGGPAGLTAANTAKALNKSVALINAHQELGGAGINTGTVPSKTLRETALALSGMKSRNLYGVDLSLRREATVADFLRHELNVKKGLNLTALHHLETEKADVYFGSGVFEDAHTIRVHASEPTQKEPGSYNSSEDALIRGGRILIATGSAPVRPETFPFSTPGVYDSDTILELDRLPKTLAVIGAGVVGSEYACTFNALGTTVHVIDGHDVLLPFLDREVSRALMEAMERNGIFFHWNERADACRAAEPNGVSLTLCSGATLALDAVLVATGRKSNTEKLNLSAAGVKVGQRGVIPVDERYQTEVPHIYAAGNVIGFPALASTSMQQSHLAVRHAFGAQLPRHAFRLL